MYRDNAVHANKISQRGDSLGSENAVVYSITQIGGPALVLIVKQTLVSRGGGELHKRCLGFSTPIVNAQTQVTQTHSQT